MKVKHTNLQEFRLVFAILWPVLSGLCSFFSELILQDVLNYVDDIIVYSNTFEEHVKHLDAVLGKLTTAGCTINIDKCNFCKQEIKFLGHFVSDKKVKVDPERISAISNYPAPRNQTQLRQFLGTCNYHHRFIINYANYVAPLLGMLKKGMQIAFETLREKFANTIQLIPSDE